jgi:xanthine dehydrogenase accessory factor
LIGAAGSTRAVLEQLSRVQAAGQTAVLAVVVATTGSTYRKRGALALIEADGRKTGVLSGGCLEAQLLSAAATALRSKQASWLVFDSLADDDLLFGSGSGCRGRTQVLLWPLDAAQDAAALGLLQQLIEAPLQLSLQVDPHAEVPTPVLRRCDEASSQQGMVIGPIPRIWMVGAGAEAALLTQLLRAQGWWIGLSEHRAGWREVVDLSAVDRLLSTRPTAAAAQLLPADVMLLMSHNAQTDLEALAIAAATPETTQLGLLGPPARRDALLAELSDEQRASLLPRLFAPVGLRLGGEGPLAIALSISAWLLDWRSR